MNRFIEIKLNNNERIKINLEDDVDIEEITRNITNSLNTNKFMLFSCKSFGKNMWIKTDEILKIEYSE